MADQSQTDRPYHQDHAETTRATLRESSRMPNCISEAESPLGRPEAHWLQHLGASRWQWPERLRSRHGRTRVERRTPELRAACGPVIDANRAGDVVRDRILPSGTLSTKISRRQPDFRHDATERFFSPLRPLIRAS